MKKSYNYFLGAGLLVIFLSSANIASADVTLNPGEVQLSVAGILLDVEGSASALDEISFSGSSFDIIINDNQSVTFSSSDRRQFSFSPSSASSYITRTCTSLKSSLAIDGSALSGPLTITITPESSTCTSSSSDSGGTIFGPGEGGSFANYNFGPTPDTLFPTPTPEPTVIPIPTIPPQIILPEIQPGEIPTVPVITPPTPPVSPYEPTAPIYIPPQPVSPAEEIPSSPVTETTPTGIFGFILLYWPWIIASLAIITLFGILLFIALRE